MINLSHRSRFEVKSMLSNRRVPFSTLIISINDTLREEHEIRNLCNVVGVSAFETFQFKDDEESFTPEIALKIKELVDPKFYLVDNIVVHCFAGVSRSAAVAKWINDYKCLGEKLYKDYKQHNRHVYDVLCSVSDVPNMNNHYCELSENQNETR